MIMLANHSNSEAPLNVRNIYSQVMGTMLGMMERLSILRHNNHSSIANIRFDGEMVKIDVVCFNMAADNRGGTFAKSLTQSRRL